jgi:inorganic phosphate transporter, PiT family
MGVIALALYTHGSISSFYIPTWVKIAAGLTIAAGTYVGGWRVIRTLGQRIYKLQPEHGFSAQVAAGTTLYLGTHFGFPISTTHAVSGSVMGAGATKRFSAVRWGVAGNIVFAWLLTLPAAALVAAALYYPVSWIL